MYAQLSDVKARAGALARAWSRDTEPSDGDIEKLLQNTSDELDAAIGAMGFPTPITDTVAAASLVSPNADMALLLAIDATWPGGSGDVADLRAQVADRVLGYRNLIEGKDLPAMLLLGAQQSASMYAGASNFWNKDAFTYEWWSRYASRLAGYPWSSDPWGVPIADGPVFTKGMRL